MKVSSPIVFLGAVASSFVAASSNDKGTHGKLAIRIVYPDNFDQTCQPDDAVQIFELIKSIVQSVTDHRPQLRGQQSAAHHTCHHECQWIDGGHCSVVKPWMSGPCRTTTTEEASHEDLGVFGATFDDFENGRLLKHKPTPYLALDDECVEVALAVRMALTEFGPDVTSEACRDIFHHYVEVTCFRGYN